VRIYCRALPSSRRSLRKFPRRPYRNFHPAQLQLARTQVLEWYSYQVEDPERFMIRIQRKLERASLAISALVIPSADLNGLSWASESGQHLDRGGGLQIAVFQFSFWVTRLRQNPTNSRAAIVAVLAGSKVPPLSTPPANFRVVAIMSSLNEADIIGPFCGPASTVEGHGHHPDMSDCVSMPTHRLPCSRAQDKIFRGDFPGADE
jgi:hypothetical protein